MTMYMAIDMKDKYRLPLFVTENPHVMAKKFHTTVNNVWSSASHYKETGLEKKFICVEVEDEEGITE